MSRMEISELPLRYLFGSEAAYHTLMYLENYERGYASGIAKTFGCALNSIQKQLAKFEEVGLLVSCVEGASRMYYFNRGPVADALRVFLRGMLEKLPEATCDQFYRQRRRPRRMGKQ